ncbi:MAG: EamA family transporter [Bdellovibrionota bacterium]
MGPSSNRKRGVVEVALAGFCFGFLGIFGRFASRNGLELGELLTYRFAVASGLLALTLLVLDRKKLLVSRRQIVVCAGLGILGYAIFANLYFTAINGVSVALASLLLYTYPIHVAIGARVLFGEKLSRAQTIALPVALGGLLFLLGGPGTWSSSGDGGTSAKTFAIVAGLGSALCYAFYILASSRLQRTIDPLTSGTYVMFFAALGLFVFHRPDLSRVPELDFAQASIIMGIAVVCTIAPLVLFLSGLQKLGNNEASLLSTVEPLTAAAMGALILGETLATREWIGGALVIAALVITALGRESTTPN